MCMPLIIVYPMKALNSFPAQKSPEHHSIIYSTAFSILLYECHKRILLSMHPKVILALPLNLDQSLYAE